MLNYFLDTQAFTSMAKMNDLSMCFCIQILKRDRWEVINTVIWFRLLSTHPGFAFLIKLRL